jgi:hypothetical protein
MGWRGFASRELCVVVRPQVRVERAFWAVSIVAAGTIASACTARAESPRYDILELHRLLVIDNVRKASEIERNLERTGGVIVSGVVGEAVKLPDGQFHVWLKTARFPELIARFVVPVALAKERAVALHCPAPMRSYALVIGACRLQ